MIRFVAEPKLSESETRMLRETQSAAVTIMIATHESDRTTCQLRKGLESLAKRIGQTKGTMDQVTKNDQGLGL